MGVLRSRTSQSELVTLQLLARHTWGQREDLLDGREGHPQQRGQCDGRCGGGEDRGWRPQRTVVAEGAGAARAPWEPRLLVWKWAACRRGWASDV